VPHGSVDGTFIASIPNQFAAVYWNNKKRKTTGREVVSEQGASKSAGNFFQHHQ